MRSGSTRSQWHLATDMTQMAYVATATYPVYEPRTFLFPNGYGTLGFGLPAAIGAKIGCPDKQVVCVVGDGGFQYSMGELAVAIQENWDCRSSSSTTTRTRRSRKRKSGSGASGTTPSISRAVRISRNWPQPTGFHPAS